MQQYPSILQNLQNSTWFPTIINMSTKLQEIYIQVFNKAKKTYRPFYNLYLYDLYTKKCECYSKHPNDPIAYYKCFDSIEKIVIKDKKTVKELQDNLEDEFTICKYECKSTDSQGLADCVSRCGDSLVGGLLEVYENFYREKVGQRKEYGKLKMREGNL